MAVELWLSLLYGSYNGAMVVYLTALMPEAVRASGFSLAYSLATALFGGFTPSICTYLIQRTGNRAYARSMLIVRRCSQPASYSSVLEIAAASSTGVQSSPLCQRKPDRALWICSFYGRLPQTRGTAMGIAQGLKQVSEEVLQVGESSLYPALQRLLSNGWVKAEWGASENNRKARYYTLTASGRKQLAAEREEFERMSGAIQRVLEMA